VRRRRVESYSVFFNTRTVATRGEFKESIVRR
jgi:phage head maturation protease